MSITPKNIDQWLFNYYEGNLTPAEIKQLEGFLRNNPDFYEDAEAWKDSFVEEAVPAFDPSFLIKETSVTSMRRRLAYAALILLLLGASGAGVWYTLHNQPSAPIASAHGQPQNGKDNHTHTVTGNWFNHSATASNNNYSNASTIDNTHTYSNTNTSNSTEANAINHTVNPANIPVIDNHHNGRNNNVNTVVQPVNNTPNGAAYTYQPNALVSPANAANNHNTTTLPGPAANTAQNNHVTLTGIIVIETVTPDEAMTRAMEEHINLTLHNDPATAGNKQVVNVTSDLNPDALVKNSKTDDQVKEPEIISKQKSKIPVAKGFTVTNQKNVLLIQPVNFAFENNASYSMQNYAIDGYVGVNYQDTKLGENHSGIMAGVSQYMRKIKTTFNLFGRYGSNMYYQQSGVTLQAATNIKLDRYQTLIPSLSVDVNQYQFEKLDNGMRTNYILPETHPSYFTRQLTGHSDYEQYKNGTQVNLSTGVLYHHKNFYTSLGINGLLQPKFEYSHGETGSNKPVKNYATINFVAGTEFVSNKHPEFSFSPQVAMEARNFDANIYVGGSVRYRTLYAGTGVAVNGSINGFIGLNHKRVSLQYRFLYDKLATDPMNNIGGHYLSAHFNVKGWMKKPKAILDSEK